MIGGMIGAALLLMLVVPCLIGAVVAYFALLFLVRSGVGLLIDAAIARNRRRIG